MRTLFTCLAGGVIILSLASCGGATKNESGVSEAPPETQGPAVYLEGIYATSSKLPLDQYAAENVFDNNPATYWSTAVGAGADEGLMLYFAGETYVKEIKLTPATGSDLAAIKLVSVYADGHKIKDSDLSSSIAIDKALTSLFIKIDATDHSEVIATGEGLDGEQSLEVFDSKFSVGVSGIEIYGNDARLELKPPVSVAGTVVASSVLSPADAYAAAQLFDSRKEFVWAEGGKGSGENESLSFWIEDDQRISAIKIWNGYQRSDKHFSANARIKTFEFGFFKGQMDTYTLQDTMEPQVIELNEPLSGREFVLTILEVYPGKDYKDLVVSEILFFDGDTPFVIGNSGAEANMESLLGKTKGTVLENYIDRRLKNYVEAAGYTSEKSLILRSNRTFVLYDHTYMEGGSKEENKEIVADGNWEIVEQNSEYAKVRIFGKLFNVSETVEAYKGNSTSESIKIFQDNLHITPVEVKGEKYIDAFYNKQPDTL